MNDMTHEPHKTHYSGFTFYWPVTGSGNGGRIDPNI